MSRILIVDDDEDILSLTERWLLKAGYEVDKALSGQEAINICKQKRPDLVLLDYAMPDLDGPSTYRSLKAEVGIENMKIVFRTGAEDMASLQAMGDLLPDGILPKSEGKPALLNCIESLL